MGLTPGQMNKLQQKTMGNMGMRSPTPPPSLKPEEEKSELVAFIEARNAARKTYPFPLEGFLGLGDVPIHKYVCRVVTKTEATKAIVGATRYVEECCQGTTLAKDDPDLMTDAKAVFVLWEACRRAENPLMPAFPSPRWMMDNFTAEQIAILFNNYALCVAQEGTMIGSINDEMVEGLSDAIVTLAETDLPGLALSRLSREVLVQFAFKQALRIAELKLELYDAHNARSDGSQEESSSGEAGLGTSANRDGAGDEGGGQHDEGYQDLQEHHLPPGQ